MDTMSHATTTRRSNRNETFRTPQYRRALVNELLISVVSMLGLLVIVTGCGNENALPQQLVMVADLQTTVQGDAAATSSGSAQNVAAATADYDSSDATDNNATGNGDVASDPTDDAMDTGDTTTDTNTDVADTDTNADDNGIVDVVDDTADPDHKAEGPLVDVGEPTNDIVSPIDAPSGVFMAYTPDGNIDVNSPLAVATMRPRMIATFPKIKAFGFGRYMTPLYMSIARNQETADAYFAPLVAAGQAEGIEFVPGFWLHDITANIHGLATAAPYNVVGSNPHLNHPMNPTAIAEQDFWDEVVRVSQVMARGAHSRSVFIDAEFIFWQHREHDFFSDEQMAAIKPMIREAVRTLQDEGITLSMYHPYVNVHYNTIRRIGSGLFMPEGPDDPLGSVEHMVPGPYYSQANWVLWEPEQIEQSYVDEGFNADQVRFGFASQHINGGGLIGFTPALLDSYMAARPGVLDRSWYFCSHSVFEQLANDFEMLAGAVAE